MSDEVEPEAQAPEESEWAIEPGGPFPPPMIDDRTPLPGDIPWMEPHTWGVSSQGPSLLLWVDFRLEPRFGDQEVVATLRLRRVDDYVDGPRADYRDAYDHLASSTRFRMPPEAEITRVPMALPFLAFPRGTGGKIDVEVTLYLANGRVLAVGSFPVELPEDVSRSPDRLTVTTHALVALARATDGSVEFDEVERIGERVTQAFGLDAIGVEALYGILHAAVDAPHTVETLAEAILWVLPELDPPAFVELLYAAARADGLVSDAELAFIADLLARLGITDHVQQGGAALAPFYTELELEPGAPLDTVRKQWKKLVRDYHPDRVHTLARGFVDYATRRTAAINDAYAALAAALASPEADDPTDAG